MRLAARRQLPQRSRSGRAFPVVSFVYLSVECPSNKFYRINCRPNLGAKLLDRFFHGRRQVSPPVNSLTHRFFDSSQHLLYCNFTVGCRPLLSADKPLRTAYSKTAALLPRQYLRTRRIYVTSALLFRDAVAPPLCPFNSHCTGTRAGAPLSLIKSTRNFAGLVPLAFRSTTWTSSGPSYNVCPGVSVTCCPSFSCITTEPSST